MKLAARESPIVHTCIYKVLYSDKAWIYNKSTAEKKLKVGSKAVYIVFIMDLKTFFTSDEEFDYLEDKDVTASMTGYIDSIYAPAPAGIDNEILFKFIVSNGHKRIPILMWGSDLIDRYLKDVCSGRVIDINGGFCRAVLPSKIKDENMVPFEICIRENTEIKFLGYHALLRCSSSNFAKATFDNIHSMEGRVEISGYIRTKFLLTHNRSGQMSYSVGAITDGKKKLSVQVNQFEINNLELGDYVTIKGTVKAQDGLMVLLCDKMSDVQLNPETKPLPESSVRRGSRPIKRVRSATETNL